MEYNNNITESGRLLERLQETEKEAIRRGKESEEQIAKLQTRIEELYGELEIAGGKINELQHRWEQQVSLTRKATNDLVNLQDYLVQVIDDGDLTDDDVIDNLVQNYGLQIDQEVEVTLTVDVTLRVSVPRGTDIERDDFSFSQDAFYYNGDTVDVQNYSVSVEDTEVVE